MPGSEDLLLEVIQNSAAFPAHIRKAVITALVLASPIDYFKLWGHVGNEIRRGKLTGDDRLLRAMYRSSSKRQRIQLIGSFAASTVGPRTFKDLFEDAYFRCRPTRLERGRLAQAASRFFDLHPRLSAGPLESLILLLLRSSEWEQKIHGLLVVARLDHLRDEDLARVLAAARSRSEPVRTNAWIALANLAGKPGTLGPSVISELRVRAETLLANPNEAAQANIQLFLAVTRSEDRKPGSPRPHARLGSAARRAPRRPGGRRAPAPAPK